MYHVFVATQSNSAQVQKLNFAYKEGLIRKNIFACLFSVHNTISLSRHEQVCLMRLRFRELLLPSSGNVNDYVAHI